MKQQQLLSAIGIFLITIVMMSCSQHQSTEAKISRDQVFQTTLMGIRLGDGVPLHMNLAVRWKIEDVASFEKQFASPAFYDSLVLKPRQRELVSNVANGYPSVDSVFMGHRQLFINDVKKTLTANLGEPGITIKEIILSDLGFPVSFLNAKEAVGLAEQELERIRQKSIVDQASADAARKKANAEGEVAIAQARVDGEVEKINAKTEESRRLMSIARAKTESQVAEMKAQDDAKRLELLAAAEATKQKELNKIEVAKQQDMENIQIAKKKQLELNEMEVQLELAKLCSENPGYANFLVNKELASKVEIAVLPAGMDGNVFGGLLNNKMAANK